MAIGHSTIVLLGSINALRLSPNLYLPEAQVSYRTVTIRSKEEGKGELSIAVLEHSWVDNGTLLGVAVTALRYMLYAVTIGVSASGCV